MTAIINPRTDLARVAAQMYRALKSKSCGCGYRIVDGTRTWVICGGCLAIEAYEAVTAVLPCP